MDIEFARTFLAVVETGSFLAAAERVHVTQSTVSMRIKAIEERLGQPLFDRKKTGVSLTAAGQQFQKHAQALVRIWDHARLEASLPERIEATFAIGGQYSLWDGYLLRWLPWMREALPDVAIRAQFGSSPDLMQKLSEASLDLAIVYRPQSRPGLKVEMLFEEELVLVSSEANPSRSLSGKYILVNWGPEFQADHLLNYPDLSTPGLFIDLGTLGINFLTENSASGYFPLRLAKDFVDKGDLTLVSDAPVFSYPTYAVFPSEGDTEVLETALDGLRQLAKTVV